MTDLKTAIETVIKNIEVTKGIKLEVKDFQEVIDECSSYKKITKKNGELVKRVADKIEVTVINLTKNKTEDKEAGIIDLPKKFQEEIKKGVELSKVVVKFLMDNDSPVKEEVKDLLATNGNIKELKLWFLVDEIPADAKMYDLGHFITPNLLKGYMEIEPQFRPNFLIGVRKAQDERQVFLLKKAVERAEREKKELAERIGKWLEIDNNNSISLKNNDEAMDDLHYFLTNELKGMIK